ncbi:hypothetical protein BC332_01423 [Capsicum chinense]|nr:hypothetical protein BC332_01423 [Capsicum chinense]
MPLKEALNRLRISTNGKVLRNGRMRTTGNDEEKDEPSQWCSDRLKLSTSTKNILLSGNSQIKRMPDKVNLQQRPGTSSKKMIHKGDNTMNKVEFRSEEKRDVCKKKTSLSKRYRDYYVGELEDDTDDYEVFLLSDGHHIPSNTRSQGADVSPESKLKNSPKATTTTTNPVYSHLVGSGGVRWKLSACSSLPSWAPAKLNGEQCLGTSSKKKSPRANSTMDKVDNSEDEWNVFNEKSSLSNDGKKKQRIYEKDAENKRTSVRRAAASLKRYDHNYFVGEWEDDSEEYEVLPISDQVTQEAREVNCLAVNCHQCRRSDRRTVVPCTKCKEKFYCIKCIREWYPELEEEEVSELCPYCHGKCNCNLCLHSSGMLKDQNKPISWVANCDGYIICAPVEMGGCGKYILELQHLLPRNWTSTLKAKAEKILIQCNFCWVRNREVMRKLLVANYEMLDFETALNLFNLVSSHHWTIESTNDPQQLHRAASRVGSDDNCLYSTTAKDAMEDDALVHFHSIQAV